MNKENLIKYLLEGNKKEGETWDVIGEKFGFSSGNAARHIWRKYRKGLKQIDDVPSVGKQSFEENVKDGTATLNVSTLEEIKSLEALILFCKIDINIWDVDRHIQNYWGNSSNPHWQTKAWLVKKKIDSKKVLVDTLLSFDSKYIPLQKRDIFINDVFVKPVSLFISLADPHIDKRTLDKTTIEDKCTTYLQVLENLLYRAYKAHQIDEIVYVLGNDYFTSDNYFPSTTNGTPQQVTDDFGDSYEKGFDLAVTAINKLKQFCNKLKVIFVPANHDRTKSFCMLHALEVYFRPDANIEFDRTGENTKVYSYGETMIGMHHGDTVVKDMPLYFASKYRKEWGNAKYTEIALADKHHKKMWKFKLEEDEIAGTRMFISPALTATDVWHKDKNYDLAILAGSARIYDKEKGFVGELEERI